MEREQVHAFLEDLDEESRVAIKILNEITAKGNEYRNYFKSNFDWETDRDARLTAFGKIVNPAILPQCHTWPFFGFS